LIEQRRKYAAKKIVENETGEQLQKKIEDQRKTMRKQFTRKYQKLERQFNRKNVEKREDKLQMKNLKWNKAIWLIYKHY